MIFQNYSPIYNTKIYLADAGSTDKTVEIARQIASRGNLLEFEVIPGGLPSVGRNAGAKLATTDYVLFMDADVELADPDTLVNAVSAMREGRKLVTTDLYCPSGRSRDRLLYSGANLCQRVSKYFGVPFATGMFMLWDHRTFNEIGGFDESALYAEDYQISKQVKSSGFAVTDGGVNTTNRRFMKMGMFTVAGLFLKTALFGHSDYYFRKDQNYWTPF